MSELAEAARKLIAHWDTPAWKQKEMTGEYIAELRAALLRFDNFSKLRGKSYTHVIFDELANKEIVCADCGKPTMHIGNICYGCLHKEDK